MPGGGTGGMGGGRRGGGMGGGGAPGGMARGTRATSIKYPSAKTVQKYNPAELLLEKHKKLKLTDGQQAQLKDLRLQIFDRSADLLARYDSVQREFKPPQPGADGAQQGAFQQMRELNRMVDSLQQNRRAAVQQVLAVLTDENQRKKAAELLDKQDIKFTKEFPALSAPRGTREPGGDASSGEFGRRRPPA
ncbi:MAG: Spy/CpxP family protein refolding chaperone, partial [Gemmatimonadaceae bacterium]